MAPINFCGPYFHPSTSPATQSSIMPTTIFHSKEDTTFRISLLEDQLAAMRMDFQAALAQQLQHLMQLIKGNNVDPNSTNPQYSQYEHT
jgi:hypothetical protein